MQSKSEGGNRIEPDPHGVPPTAIYSEPWWRSVGYGALSPGLRGGNASNSSSMECPNGSESNDGHSLSNGGLNEEDDGNKETQTTASSRSAGTGRQEHHSLQHVASTVPVMHDECLTQPPQLELVGHSIACASNPYQDPFYGGMMAAYGHQPLGYPPFVGLPHARMALPIEMAQEPVYVNAKQYQGILRRRQARAKAELEKRVVKVRKPYLHESRHQHAMRRTRGTGGRFAKKKDDADTSKPARECKKRTGSGVALSSPRSASSSGSEPLPADSAETWNSSLTQQEARGSQMHEARRVNGSSSSSSHYQNRGGSISSNQASHRPLAIQ